MNQVAVAGAGEPRGSHGGATEEEVSFVSKGGEKLRLQPMAQLCNYFG